MNDEYNGDMRNDAIEEQNRRIEEHLYPSQGLVWK